MHSWTTTSVLSLAAVLAFYGLNGVRMTLTNDEAYELVVAVAAGSVRDVEVIAERLEGKTEPRVV
jgi:death-on-curing protein